MSKIRLLIVDDSAIMRKAIQQAAESDPGIEVVGQARHGREGVDMVAALKPDVVTMDVEMPEMNGIEALRAIMSDSPARVLMVSTLTSEGASTTLEALALGAIDAFAKPTGASGAVQITALQRDLPARIRAVASANLDALQARRPPRPAPASTTTTTPASATASKRLVLIGTSTGGPNALATVLPALPADLPAGVLIVQHMPPVFTGQLARRLNSQSALEVREAVDGDEIRDGVVLIAPGGKHMVLRQRTVVGLDDEPADADHRPSVDVLFHSAAAHWGRDATAVVLTGMGRDGCDGAAALKRKGTTIVAQDESTCVVFGMPGAVVGAGLADSVCPLSMVPAMIGRSLRD